MKRPSIESAFSCPSIADRLLSKRQLGLASILTPPGDARYEFEVRMVRTCAVQLLAEPGGIGSTPAYTQTHARERKHEQTRALFWNDPEHAGMK